MIPQGARARGSGWMPRAVGLAWRADALCPKLAGAGRADAVKFLK